MIGTLWQDIRFGLRVMAKYPGFAAAAIITMALGIGANTAIFSVVNGVLLRPLPYPEPDRLVTIRYNMSVPDLADFQERSRSFEEGGGAVLQALDYTGGAEPIQVQAALSTYGLFPALGGKAALGRVFSAQEDRIGGERVVVLTHEFWSRQFGGDKSILGRTIPLSGNDYTVIGVMPQDFVLPYGKPDLYASVRAVNPVASSVRGVHFLRTYLRLKPGVTLSQAQGEAPSLEKQLEQIDPIENKNRRIELIPLHERVVGDTRPALLVLFGAVGLVLLIACANFANLLLARSASRRQEIVIRTALGAGRRRLTRQLLTESVMLSLSGGAIGLMFAMWGVDLLMAFQPANLPRLESVRLDRYVLLFTLGVSLLTGLLFGLVPAWRASKANLSEALKEGGRTGTPPLARHRFSNLLVVSELALAILLLTGAGLLLKGFWRLSAVDPGFKPEGLVTMRLELPEARYKEIPPQTRFRERVIESINSLPGTEVAMVSDMPLSGDVLDQNFVIEGVPAPAGEEPELYTRTIMGDYFRLMGISLIKGRAFSSQDREGSQLVAIINEATARLYFKDREPLGARLRWARDSGENWVTIVGVVSDVRHLGLGQPDEPALYTPYAQTAQPWKRWQYLVARSSNAQSHAALIEALKKQVWAVDSQIPLTKARTMTDIVAASVTPQRFNMTLLGIFALVALVLASVGIYGVMSFVVTERTHEIGIRMALGASARDVLKMVLGRGLLLTMAGVGLGLLAALALTRVMASMLFGVTATDPWTFAGVSLLLACVALLSCYLPARRATRIDPMTALRYE